MPLPQCGAYEALEGIYPGQATKNRKRPRDQQFLDSHCIPL